MSADGVDEGTRSLSLNEDACCRQGTVIEASGENGIASPLAPDVIEFIVVAGLSGTRRSSGGTRRNQLRCVQKE